MRPDTMRRLADMEASKCPKCGEEPHFLEHIEKWYCYGCNSYVEDGTDHVCEDEAKKVECAEAIEKEIESLDEEPKLECKNCGAELEGLKDGKLFCFMCETYQDDLTPKAAQEPKPANDAQKILDVATLPASAPIPAAIPPAAEAPIPAPEPPVPEPPVEAKLEAPVPVELRMCVTCGQPLKWIDKYQRHYCYGCRKYAQKEGAENHPSPAEAVAKDTKKCPDCGSELKFIDKYSEHYCFACKKYPLKAAKKAEPVKNIPVAPPAPAKPPTLACPKCKGKLKWVDKYSRYYCFECKEYAPKGIGGPPHIASDKRHCPVCKQSMKFIQEYNEWYCFKCKKYTLRPSKPVLLL